MEQAHLFWWPLWIAVIVALIRVFTPVLRGRRRETPLCCCSELRTACGWQDDRQMTTL